METNNSELMVKVVPPHLYDKICTRNWGSICLPERHAPQWLSEIDNAPTRAALGSGPAFNCSTKHSPLISSANLIGHKDIVLDLQDCEIPVRAGDKFFTMIYESRDKNALLLDDELEVDTDWIDDLLDHHLELDAYAVPKKWTSKLATARRVTTMFSKQIDQLVAKIEFNSKSKPESISRWEDEGGASTP